MKTLRIAVATMVVAACGLLAALSPAAAYPNVTCHITDPGRACEGQPLRLTATVDPAVDCSPISITWGGMTRSGTGSKLATTFPTHEGDADRDSLKSDTVSCTYTDGAGTHTVSASGSVEISECDNSDGSDSDGSDSDSDDSDSDDSDSDSDSDSDNGGLPNTGGQRLLWLILGLLLLTGGATVVWQARGEDGAAR